MMKSTMNAPLSESEEARIEDAWDKLQATARLHKIYDPVEMLNICTELVGAVWELRRAIDDGWHGANKRAFPSPEPARKKHTLNLRQADFDQLDMINKVLDDLKTAGFTDEEVIAAMKESQK